MTFDFAEQFLKIQKTFVAGLPQRIENILRENERHKRHVLLHKLAGAAGSYDFSDLSALANEAIDAQKMATDLPLKAAMERLEQAIAKICLAH